MIGLLVYTQAEESSRLFNNIRKLFDCCGVLLRIRYWITRIYYFELRLSFN